MKRKVLAEYIHYNLHYLKPEQLKYWGLPTLKDGALFPEGVYVVHAPKENSK